MRTILIKVFLVLVVLSFSSSFSWAEDFRIISTDELKAMMDSKSSRFVLIDTRTKEEFEEAHIPSAINIPEKSLIRRFLPISNLKRTLLPNSYFKGNEAVLPKIEGSPVIVKYTLS